MKQLLGVHIKPELDDMKKTIESLGNDINTVQFFVNASYDKEIVQKAGKVFHNSNITGYIHSSYTINCAKEWDESSWWINYLIFEIKTAYLLRAKGIVLHTGTSVGLNEKIAINNLYTCMRYIHSKTKKESSVKIILETPAGKGTEILTNYDEFINFMGKFDDDRFGMCLDTCHVFSAGYDIRKISVFNNMLKKCIDKLGSNKLALIHLNDSKKDLAERKDSHESLGYGFIGRESFNHIIKTITDLKIPIILETPSIYHDNEIKWIKDICHQSCDK